MHPLMTAYIKLFELRDMAIRQWSPYYPTWRNLIADEEEFIRELKAHGN